MWSFFLKPTKLADFDKVQSIQTLTNESDLKGVLQLRIAGAAEPLTINFSSLSAAEDLADLIDGYCRVVDSGRSSCWNRKGQQRCNSSHLFVCFRGCLCLYFADVY